MIQIDYLRKKGHRITKQRKLVYDLIQKKPITADEIHFLLKKQGQRINLASIYRSFDFFITYKIIREINFLDGKKRYERVGNEKHHHHLICRICGLVEDIILINEYALLNEINTIKNFAVDHHSMEFFGKCQNCQ
jgi:Fur family transcriptional regulator, ferric uptake regulator